MERKKIRIGFTDFWKGYVPEYSYIVKILKRYYDVDILDTENLDERQRIEYLFYSCYSQNYLDFDCIRIFYTGENLIPDFNLCDYAIGFEKMIIGDRYFRDPLWYEYVRGNRSLIPDKTTFMAEKEKLKNRKFCAMVVSNGNNADPFRTEFFYRLSEYKQVDSGGRYLNNIDSDNGQGVPDKLDFFRNYKFSFAFENVSHEGYCTEKLIESFAAGTIPVYWGDPDVAEYFNKDAFVNCHDFTSVDQIIDRIKEIDGDDEKYCAMLMQPVFADAYHTPEQQDARFEKWLISIFEKDYCIRRNRMGRMKGYEDICRSRRDRKWK